nr:EOG090X05XL [Daphnia pulex]
MKMLVTGDADSSSTSETEDEDGEAWDSEVEKQFFQTLASLKKKDPSIYNAEKKFFDKAAQSALPKKSTKEEAFTLRDYERKIMVEKGGKMSDDEDAPPPPRTFQQEQEELKIGFKAALQDSDSESEDLLTVRPKSEIQKEKEEEEYKEWLKGRKEDITNEETKKQLEPLKEYWSNPKLDENEAFLKDFFLNKRYKCSEDKNYIPTYEEVVHDSEGDLSEDEKTLEQQMEFEHKYNFRFEEPDPEFIKRYPRTIADSMRKPDTSRKAKRDEVKDRKKREKEEKKEDLKMLKKYKLKEIQEKLEQLKNITGNASLPFQDDDLEGDFDPDQYDRKMGEIFNQDYYHVDNEDQKPEFPYDPEIDDENWDDYKGQEAGPSTSNDHYNDNDYDGPHCEDPNFNMDCDYEEAREESKKEMIEMTRRNRGRKKSIFAQKLETKKPVFDPEEHPNYEEYLEEYYKLDYEDIIGDQPVRFKYRTVVENDFGLDVEEILLAREKELNQWCSVKKMSQYRTEREEMNDYYTYITKKKNVSLKKRVLPSVFAENSEALIVADQEKDRKKRRRNQGKDEDPDPQPNPNPEIDHQEIQEETVPKKKKRKNKGKDEPFTQVNDFSQITEPNHSEKPNEVAQERRKDNTDDAGNVSVASEHEQPKPKKLKADKPQVENEIPVATELVKGNENPEKKKKKKKKKNLSEMAVVTVSNPPVIPEKAVSPSKDFKMEIDSTGKKSEATCTENSPKKKKKKKQAKKLLVQEEDQKAGSSSVNEGKKKKKKKKKNKNATETTANKKSATIRGFDITDDRLKAYGIRNPKKFKNAIIFGNLKKSKD